MHAPDAKRRDYFSKPFGGKSRQKPQYGGSELRVLTAVERELLLINTAQLLTQSKVVKEAAMEAQRQGEEERQRKQTIIAGHPSRLKTMRMPPSPPLAKTWSTEDNSLR